jgi:hypothetical protein
MARSNQEPDMKIASLPSPLEVLSTLLGGGQVPPARSDTAAATASGEPSGSVSSAAFDVRHATPADLHDFVSRLHRAGVLPTEEFRQLSQLVQELQHSGLAADRPADLVKYVQRRLQQQRQELTLAAGDPHAQRVAAHAVHQWEQWLELLRKLEALQRQGTARGIDATV